MISLYMVNWFMVKKKKKENSLNKNVMIINNFYFIE